MSGGARGVRALLDRVIGLADKPTDDDDLRLRKRVVLIAGYVLIVGARRARALEPSPARIHTRLSSTPAARSRRAAALQRRGLRT